MTWGGMPRAVLEKDDAVRSKYLKDLFAKVYLKDIRERHRLQSDLITSRIIDELCSSIGSLTNPHKLVSTFSSEGHAKTSDRTVKKYLDYLEESFLFAKAGQYDVRGKKYLAYPQKYYATDVGPIQTLCADMIVRRAFAKSSQRFAKIGKNIRERKIIISLFFYFL